MSRSKLRQKTPVNDSLSEAIGKIRDLYITKLNKFFELEGDSDASDNDNDNDGNNTSGGDTKRRKFV